MSSSLEPDDLGSVLRDLGFGNSHLDPMRSPSRRVRGLAKIGIRRGDPDENRMGLGTVLKEDSPRTLGETLSMGLRRFVWALEGLQGQEFVSRGPMQEL